MADKAKSEKFGELLDWAERALNWLPVVVGAIGTGGLAGWAATATKWLDQYRPLSWVIAVLVGASLFMFIYWLWAAARLWLAKASRYKAIPEKSAFINPLDSTFDKKRIDVQELRDPVTHIVHDKTFVECELIGHGAVVFSASTFDGWGGAFNCEFIVLRDDVPGLQLFNVTIFTNCNFKRCKYFNLSLMFNRESANTLDGLSATPLPWLTKK